MSDTRKILITGATGGLGNGVAKTLTANPQITVLALVRDAQTEKAQELASLGVVLREGDYNNKQSLVDAFAGIDGLYFVSGNDINARLSQHQNVVEASKEAKVGHIVYTSAGRKNEASNAPLFPVMETHIATEKWIEASGIDYTILRHNLYSEVIPLFLGTKEQLLQNKVVFLPAADGKTAFAPREELAIAGAKILADLPAHRNKTYAFDGSELVNFARVAEALSNILGESIPYISPSVPDFQQQMAAAGVPAEAIGMTIGFSLGIAHGEFESEQNDLEQVLGRPTTSIENFLREVYA